MKIILSLTGLICFPLMGFLYYDFCKKISHKVLDMLNEEKEKNKNERR